MHVHVHVHVHMHVHVHVHALQVSRACTSVGTARALKRGDRVKMDVQFIQVTSGHAQRKNARWILISRFVDNKPSDVARREEALIDAALGNSTKPVRCYTLGTEVSFSGYDCVVGMEGDKCVGVAVYRKVKPRRGGGGHWELLLLAVPKNLDRRGYGTAMVEHVKQQSAADDAKLVIISNGTAFWQSPKLQLEEVSSGGKEKLKSLRSPLVPWSHGAPDPQGRPTPIMLLSPAAATPAAAAPAAATPAAAEGAAAPPPRVGGRRSSPSSSSSSTSAPAEQLCALSEEASRKRRAPAPPPPRAPPLPPPSSPSQADSSPSPPAPPLLTKSAQPLPLSYPRRRSILPLPLARTRTP